MKAACPPACGIQNIRKGTEAPSFRNGTQRSGVILSIWTGVQPRTASRIMRGLDMPRKAVGPDPEVSAVELLRLEAHGKSSLARMYVFEGNHADLQGGCHREAGW